MKIYGVAMLAACFLIGKLMGAFLGQLLHIDGNVGGVGFAMALLILVNTLVYKRKSIPEETSQGILFWSGMYIPIVVAMSATQHVKAALTGGWIALSVGIGGTFACFLLIPLVAKIGKSQSIKEK
ncbi:MAG: malonate transporter subunit MadL [Bacteroidota bacterium]